jgi:hypothetical protein
VHQSLDEQTRRGLVEEINTSPLPRLALEAVFGPDNVWDTKELQEKFEVLGFLAPFCAVRRKEDGKEGAVMFQHAPRFYFEFRASDA